MKTYKILLVDDEPAFTRVMRNYLEDTARFEVRMENDPRKALAAAREFRPDLILLDVIMPDMDGGDVAFQLKADHALRDVPLIFLTAIVSKDFVSRHGDMIGGHPFLAKPVDATELIRAVDLALKAAA
jgi:two-component system OmpR family response regulator